MLQERPALSAILFDLRSVIGLLFVVYGLVLTILGLIGRDARGDWPRPVGIALNLWTGLVMLIVGIGFYVWAFVKPPMPPTRTRWPRSTRGPARPRPLIRPDTQRPPGVGGRWLHARSASAGGRRGCGG